MDRRHLGVEANGTPGAEIGENAPSGVKDSAATPGELSFLQNWVRDLFQGKGVSHLVEKIALLKCLQKSLDQEYNIV